MIIRLLLGSCVLVFILEGSAFSTDTPPASQRGRDDEGTAQPDGDSTREELLRSLLKDDPLETGGPETGETAPAAGDESRPSQNNAAEGGLPNGGQTVSPEYAQAAAQLKRRLRQAAGQLASGQTGETAQAAQAKAIAATEALIELARQTAPSSTSSSPAGQSGNPAGQPSKAGQSASPQAAAPPGADPSGNSQPSAGDMSPDGPSQESSKRPPTASHPASIFTEFRTGLIERTWGHLPEHMRQRLRNGGTDRSLPGYERLVDRYFESLIHSNEPPATDEP